MNIVSIEPTPSPNSMKINLNEQLADGESRNYKRNDDRSEAPDYIQQLFEIEGVKSLYHVSDFIALDRNPKHPWENILPEVRSVFGSSEQPTMEQTEETAQNTEAFGEVNVYVQMFRGIPMQVKLQEGENEQRVGLPERFMNAAMKASPSSPNMVMERKWVEQNPRYGDPEEVGQEVAEELSASYDEDRLASLVEQAFDEGAGDLQTGHEEAKQVTLETLDHPDWKVRYAALDRMHPTYNDLPVLDKALEDEKASIRRLATAYLGMIEEPEVLPYLYKALNDKSTTVRRTAGDCLSDLGFKEAMPEMIQSLSDKNKLVRWRAAMFLYELGDESAIPALQVAIQDSEFEVRMQAKMALRRIEGGEEAKGSVWHQMTQARKK
ncbi:MULTISPECIES: conserved virulence factor C family protein [Pontibacillus]|uniref:Conserved virulence factor C family protein n=1 Tax=Pontibacillus chungwhensis TaxID=265426 RepID=A0ABY8UVT5_9BACI|nr:MULTISPECIES: conserved virulence factor C family protein [Pontibacillus]MCD5323147.1 conserved virulence factor C family protein [Pontibacillus sp. HN14]WIF96535.1 conserved virulence factor C family protein [Pontibacillus chungwhensis]